MSVQYITDGNDQTTGVFIPIQEWNDLKNKLKEVGLEEMDVPEWHKEIVEDRREQYKRDPSQVQDFDQAMDDIKKQL